MKTPSERRCPPDLDDGRATDDQPVPEAVPGRSTSFFMAAVPQMGERWQDMRTDECAEVLGVEESRLGLMVRYRLDGKMHSDTWVLAGVGQFPKKLTWPICWKKL